MRPMLIVPKGISWDITSPTANCDDPPEDGRGTQTADCEKGHSKVVRSICLYIYISKSRSSPITERSL